MFFKLFPYKKLCSVVRITLVISILLVIFSLFNLFRGNGRKVSYAGAVSGENYNLDKDYSKYEKEIRADEARIRPGLGDLGKAVTLSGKEAEKSDLSTKKWAMNVYLSDLISYNRTLADYRNPSCKRVVYDAELPSVSVIIIFHNEPYSVVLRTVWSVLNSARRNNAAYKDANFKDAKTGREMKLGYPGQETDSEFVYLKEVVLVDDASTLPELKGKLDHYINTRLPANMVKMVRLPTRRGLIRARLAGSRLSRGETLIFLDAHCEVTEDWVRPLLQRLKWKRDAMLSPIIDIIDSTTFEMAGSENPEHFQVGGFNFAGHFTWIDVSQREKLRRGSEIAPTWSPTMAGGLFAVNRNYFWEIGSYDEQMNGWGGENLEISFRVWQCGGTLETIPCSRVGHVFRSFHPYAFPGNSDTHGINTARMAEVWMDEYKELYYLNRPDLRKSPKIGDLTHRKVLREKLQCKPFQWYLDNVYPEKFIPVKDVVGFGRIRNPATGLCLDTLQQDENPSPLGAYTCHNSLGPTQYFVLTRQGQLRSEEMCAHVRYSRDAEILGDVQDRKVYLSTCKRKRNEDQKWKITSSGEIRSSSGFRLCLDAHGLDDGANLLSRPCDDEDTQKWTIEYTEDNLYGLKGKNSSERAQNLAIIRNAGKARKTRDLLSIQYYDDYSDIDNPILARLGSELPQHKNSLAHVKKHKHHSKHSKKHHHRGRKLKNATNDKHELTNYTSISKSERRSETENENNHLLLMIKRDGNVLNDTSDILELELKPVNRSMKLNDTFVQDLVNILNENDVRVFINNSMFKDLVVGTDRRQTDEIDDYYSDKSEEKVFLQEVKPDKKSINDKVDEKLIKDKVEDENKQKDIKNEKSKEKVIRMRIGKNKLNNQDIVLHGHLVRPVKKHVSKDSPPTYRRDMSQDDGQNINDVERTNVNTNHDNSVSLKLVKNEEKDATVEENIEVPPENNIDEKIPTSKEKITKKSNTLETDKSIEENDKENKNKLVSERKSKEMEVSSVENIRTKLDPNVRRKNKDTDFKNYDIEQTDIKEDKVSLENNMEISRKKTKEREPEKHTQRTRKNKNIVEKNQESDISGLENLDKNDEENLEAHNSEITLGKIKEAEISLENNLENSRKKITQLDLLQKEWNQHKKEKNIERTEKNKNDDEKKQESDIPKHDSEIILGKVKEEGEISLENDMKDSRKKITQLDLLQKEWNQHKKEKNIERTAKNKNVDEKKQQTEVSLENNLENSEKKITQLDLLQKEWNEHELKKNEERTGKNENDDEKKQDSELTVENKLGNSRKQMTQLDLLQKEWKQLDMKKKIARTKKKKSLKKLKKHKKTKSHDGKDKTLYKYKAKPEDFEGPYGGSVEYRDFGQMEDKKLRRTEDEDTQTNDVPALNHIIIKNYDLMRRKLHEKPKNMQHHDEKVDENFEDNQKDSVSQNRSNTIDKSTQRTDTFDRRNDYEEDLENVDRGQEVSSLEEVKNRKTVNSKENMAKTENSEEFNEKRRNEIETTTKKHVHRRNTTRSNPTQPPNDVEVTTKKTSSESISSIEDQNHSASNESVSLENSTVADISEELPTNGTTDGKHTLRKSGVDALYDSTERLYKDLGYQTSAVKSLRKSDFNGNYRKEKKYRKKSQYHKNDNLPEETDTDEKLLDSTENRRQLERKIRRSHDAKLIKKWHDRHKSKKHFKTKKYRKVAKLLKEPLRRNITRRFNDKYSKYEPIYYRRGDHSEEEYLKRKEKLDFESRANRMDDFNYSEPE